MALNDIEHKRVENAVGAYIEKHRPPPHIRPKVDIGFRVSGQSVEIFEIRPVWKHPERKMEHPVAKATFVRSKALWKVFWMRADLKWHSYEPLPMVGTIDKVPRRRRRRQALMLLGLALSDNTVTARMRRGRLRFVDRAAAR